MARKAWCSPARHIGGTVRLLLNGLIIGGIVTQAQSTGGHGRTIVLGGATVLGAAPPLLPHRSRATA